MAYELTLAQCLTVLHGDTIASYSLVIGCFVLSLGLGAAYWAKAAKPPRHLNATPEEEAAQRAAKAPKQSSFL